MLSHLTDLVAVQAQLVLSQYRNLPKMSALISGVVAQVQEVEDALWAVVQQLDVNEAQGAWLDIIGRFVNEPRAGASDDDYRNFIRARIIANASQGTTEDLLNVIRAALNTIPGFGFVFTEWDTLAATLAVPWGVAQFGGNCDHVLLDRLRSLLRGGRAGGVNLQLLYQANQDTEMFVLGDANALVDPVGKGLDDAQAPGQTFAGEFAGAALT